MWRASCVNIEEERQCVWQFWQVSDLAPLLILSRPILGTNPRQLNVAIIAFTFYKWARKTFQLQLSRTGENTLQNRRLEYWTLFVVNINTLDNMGPIPAVHGFLDLLSGTEQTIQIGKC